MIEHFTKDPPYAYIVPRDQRDRNTAATLVEKLMTDGIEVHQATQKFTANGSTFKEGDWVVLMDQPFAALVKELFDVQHYPDLRQSAGIAAAADAGGGGGVDAVAQRLRPLHRPRQLPRQRRRTRSWRRARWARWHRGRRRAGGWRSSRSRRSRACATPLRCHWLDAAHANGRGNRSRRRAGLRRTRRTLRAIEKVEPIQGKVEGGGPVFSFSHNSNASIRAVNEILAAGGTVSFGKSESTIYASGAPASLLQEAGVDAVSLKELPIQRLGEEAPHRDL